VQHGMNPRGGGVLVLLEELMRGVPLVGQSQFNRLKQFIVHLAHGFVLPANWCNRKLIYFCAGMESYTS